MSKFDSIIQKLQENIPVQQPAAAGNQQTALIAQIAKQLNVDQKALEQFISQEQKKQKPAAPVTGTSTLPTPPNQAQA
jgi:hypothetical protein